MSYLEDTIDWQAITAIDVWLDSKVGESYKNQPLAQDWARVSKIGEEYGEAINELILSTEQNPRKPFDPGAHARMLEELADVMLTALLAMQHFTKNASISREIIRIKVASIEKRVTP